MFYNTKIGKLTYWKSESLNNLIDININMTFYEYTITFTERYTYNPNENRDLVCEYYLLTHGEKVFIFHQ